MQTSSRFFSAFIPPASFKKPVFLFLLLILAIGGFLRFYGLPDLLRFNADQARDAAIVDKMLSGEEFPLLGPKAGGTTFKLGPAFYYLEYLSALIFGHDPAGMAFFVPLLSLFSIGLFFFFSRFYFSEKISVFLTFLCAISFFVVKYSRFAWNPNVTPFFLLLFLISLLKTQTLPDRKISRWHPLLALALGVSVQLHTTLLILLPIVFLIFAGRQIFRTKNFSLSGFLLVIAVSTSLNFPLVIHDLQNNGENFRAFLEGAKKKTGDEISLAAGLIQTGRFFIESGTYVLSGRNWQAVRKPELAEGFFQSAALPAATGLFLGGFFLLIWKLRQETSDQKKDFLWLLLIFSGAAFLLLWPLSSELNDRFFLILFFLPLVLLGLILQTLANRPSGKFLLAMAAPVILFFVWSNLRIFHETYVLNAFAPGNRDYGGISLKESEELAKIFQNAARKHSLPGAPVLLADFEFAPSVSYFSEKSGLLLSDFSGKRISEEALVFSVTEQETKEKYLEKKTAYYSVLDRSEIGRFAFFALRPVTYRVGFITDIHAARSKKSDYDLKPELKSPLLHFVRQMNESFRPAVAVEGGDLIEGTDREGEKSIEDFKLADRYLQDLDPPLYHVIGNHETRGFSREEWIALTGYERSYYSIDYDNLRMIVLDGNESDTGREDDQEDDSVKTGPKPYSLTEEQLHWLQQALEEKRNSPKIVFLHYPLTQPKSGKALDLEQAQRLKKMFAENEVLAVFSGHTEVLSYDQIDEVRYFVIPGLERSRNKHVLWLDCFAEITVSEKTRVKFFYKKDPLQGEYQTLDIPSVDFDRIEK